MIGTMTGLLLALFLAGVVVCWLLQQTGIRKAERLQDYRIRNEACRRLSAQKNAEAVRLGKEITFTTKLEKRAFLGGDEITVEVYDQVNVPDGPPYWGAATLAEIVEWGRHLNAGEADYEGSGGT